MEKKLKKGIISNKLLFEGMFYLTRKNLRILTYHGISPLGLPVLEFEKQLDFISSHFNSYWISEIPALLKQPFVKKPKIFLTFDDGLKNQVKNAIPLLNKYGIKATFYIPVGLSENRRMLWNHEIRCCLLMLNEDDLKKLIGPFDGTYYGKLNAINSYIEKLKTLNIGDRQGIQEKLKLRINKPELPHWMFEEYQLMDDEDIRNVSKLVEVGSHSLFHPILTTISDDQLINEIKDSRSRLEKITGQEIVSFCYPNGIYSEKVVQYVEKYYPIAVSTNEGFVSPCDRMSVLKRIPVGKNMEQFLMRLIRPSA